MLNPWSPGGTFMVQNMAVPFNIPIFEGLSKGHSVS